MSSRRRRRRSTLGAVMVAVLVIAVPVTAAPGDLDSSFSGDGRVTLDVFPDADEAYDVVVTGTGADRRYTVAGASSAGNGAAMLARFLPDGRLDPAFGLGDGFVTHAFSGRSAVARAIVVDANGKLVVAGTRFALDTLNSGDFVVARFHPTGTPDTSFDSDGWTTVDFAGAADLGYDLALQPDGAIVVVGSASPNGGDFGVARLTANGAPDITFDGDGEVTTNFGAGEGARSVAIQHNGRIVVVGRTSSSTALARYTTIGALDVAFDGDGKVVRKFSDGFDETTAVDVRGNPAVITIAGFSSTNSFDGYVGRYLANGVADESFGTAGAVTLADVAGPASVVTLNDLAVQGGALYVAGHTNGPNGIEALVAKLDLEGRLVDAFGNGGLLMLPYSRYIDRANALALAGGDLLVAGYAEREPDQDPTDDVLLGRLDPVTGARRGFGGDGVAFMDVTQSNDFANDVDVLDDGRIVVAGTTEIGSTPRRKLFLAILRPGGGVDLDAGALMFGGENTAGHAVDVGPGGYSFAGWAAQTSEDWLYGWRDDLNGFDDQRRLDFELGNDRANDIAIAGDSTFVAGYATVSSAKRFALAKLGADHVELDDTFGVDGKLTTDVGPGDDVANAATRSGSGVVLAGTGDVLGTRYGVLVRYTATGALVGSFGGDGIAEQTLTPAAEEELHDVLRLPSGKFIAVGFHTPGTRATGTLIARFNSDGSLDTTFGGGLGYVAGPDTAYRVLYAVTRDSAGRLVAVGYSGSVLQLRTVLVQRYLPDGTVDTTFSGDGTATFGTGDLGSHVGNGVAMQNEKIVVGGSGPVGDDWDALIARVLP